MRKLIIGLGILVLFLAADVGVAWIVKPEAFASRAAMRQAAGEVIAPILVRGMKLQLKLPQQIDDATWLEDIRADGSKVIYTFGINASIDEFGPIVSDTGDNMRKTACDRDDYRKLLGYGLTIVIEFYSQGGLHAAPITFTPQMCGLDK